VGGSSQNWAGYIVHQAGARVVCVQGHWTEPKLSCPKKGDRSVAIWVGIDGAGAVSKARPLIQVGTWGYCHNGVENHYAWHEVYPNQPYSVGFVTLIHPGDRIAAAVVFRQRAFTLTLVNLTTHRRAEVVEQAPKAVRGSAEWIIEAPTGGCPNCHQLTLPSFSAVHFTAARATLGSQVAGIDGPWTRERTTMVSRHGTLAKVGPLAASGEGFTVSRP
jgi:Peptidase A4 family